jgi:hypothetical protein
MYTFVDFTSQIAGWRGVPCPTNKGVSYTNLVHWLGRDLKNRLLLLLSYSGQNPCFIISRSDTICTKIEAQVGSLSFFGNFGRIIPPELEVHTYDLGGF